jgi:hypothetical protein
MRGTWASRLAGVRTAGYVLVAFAIALVATACGGTATTEPDSDISTATQEETVPSGSSGLTSRPTPLHGTELVVRGALDGVVKDPAGNVLGTDSATGIERVDAPHGSFDSTGDGGQFFLTTKGPHRGAWTATRAGEVTFVVRNHAGDEVEETAATLPVALRRGATLTLELSSPADLESLELAVDDDGDGRRDRSVEFGGPVVGSAASDRLAPVSRIDVEHVVDATGQTVARVTITAEDRGGAGVARIQYALDASGRTGVYTEPFEAPAAGRVIVRAIDRAGNSETPLARARLGA